MPQSMQRSACFSMIGSRLPGTYTSFQSRTRSGIGRRGYSWRGVVKKPLGSAMAVSRMDAYEGGYSRTDIGRPRPRNPGSIPFQPRYVARAPAAAPDDNGP